MDEYSDGSLMDEVMQLMVAASTHGEMDADVQVLCYEMRCVHARFCTNREPGLPASQNKKSKCKIILSQSIQSHKPPVAIL